MTAKHLLDEIVRGLDGVTGGKWCQFHPHYCEEAIGTSCADWDTSHDLSAVKDGTRRRIASFKHADDAAHVDRCSPDAIREIAAYVRELERERDEALERSRDYPTISARLHDREKAREAEQAACADALARVRDLEERLAKAAEALEPFNQAALAIRTAERMNRREFQDGDTFVSGVAWKEDDKVRTITFGDFRRARTALTTIRRAEK